LGNDGNRVLALLFDMLKLFLMTKCRPYTVPVLVMMMLLLHLRSSNHPNWVLFLNFPGLFSEELGENSLGPLSRTICTDTQRGSLAHMREVYKLQGSGKLLTDHLIEATAARVRHPWEGYREDSPDEKHMVGFLRAQIRQLRANQWVHYTGKPTTWLSHRKAQANARCEAAKPWFMQTTHHFMPNVFAFIDSKIVKNNWRDSFRRPEEKLLAPPAHIAVVGPLVQPNEDDLDAVLEPVDVDDNVADIDFTAMERDGDVYDFSVQYAAADALPNVVAPPPALETEPTSRASRRASAPPRSPFAAITLAPVPPPPPPPFLPPPVPATPAPSAVVSRSGPSSVSASVGEAGPVGRPRRSTATRPGQFSSGYERLAQNAFTMASLDKAKRSGSRKRKQP
jgi:hypothetical protein